MTSPFTGGLRFWDAINASRLRDEKKTLVPECLGPEKEPTATAQSTQTTSSNSGQPNKLTESGQTWESVGPIVATGDLRKSTLSLEERIATALSVGVECVQPEELRALFQRKEHPICYDGFEPSGRMHIAQGILKALYVTKLTKCGCVFVFWVADWFAMLNNKMGGDIKKIRKVGHYFIEIWKALGMDLTNVRFLWSSDEINKNANDYWMRVMDIAQRNSISRVKRCGQIMGRGEGDDNPSAQILYPCMQCSDIFYLKADICQLGLDQRKVNMLAREYVDDWNADHKKETNLKLQKPVILSHGMLPGLVEGQAKMSKSDPDSAIFMEDSPEDVRRKIKKAFCPPGVVEDNPIVAYVRELAFGWNGHFTVRRNETNGGDVKFDSFQAFETAYRQGDLHPGDVKPSLAMVLNELLQPVRDHFENNKEAKLLLHEIRSYKITK